MGRWDRSLTSRLGSPSWKTLGVNLSPPWSGTLCSGRRSPVYRGPGFTSGFTSQHLCFRRTWTVSCPCAQTDGSWGRAGSQAGCGELLPTRFCFLPQMISTSRAASTRGSFISQYPQASLLQHFPKPNPCFLCWKLLYELYPETGMLPGLWGSSRHSSGSLRCGLLSLDLPPGQCCLLQVVEFVFCYRFP